ncbi:RadC family protein [Pseudomonas aeruginosa]|jgi:DNA repair protein RadC|uniref:RadC family protein n=1 Tax=Pseudomonas aeruginosa TaxID=287 RepID=UPI000659011B|nr:DNA repair protein RadC [Pseudomonas aeruginosa]MDX9699246.1 DNA repair protein RadC [Rhodocyclaceae bacterium]MBO3071636.1 DNA repair protein RadC [Pseudomonas aeruginosa]MDC0848606.1 DNA repair protein RadC [Pseudomonas aeruginosa]PWH91213.1 DNA repair protein RadC [Pseudomonas aeruginosa]CRN77781.1 DNA repair protein RadC [Pseudomonas aeruginosa]
MSLIVNDSCVEPRFAPASQSDDWIIRQAIALLEQRVFKAGPLLDQPQAVKDYLRLKLVAEPNEVFAIVFMNSQHRVLAYEPMFKGTLDSTAVYPRVVVQRALELNAGAVIFSHQHPSGCTEPSSADRVLTDRLKAALALIDVRVLDHIIVGQGTPYSFAESGLL